MSPVAVVILAAISASPTIIARSPDHRVALVELYTSEGCSSCPPADAALAALGADYARAVPLAFHVTYWNHIGWTDRFAAVAFDLRQRGYAQRVGDDSVYTPQIIVNGRDVGERRPNLGAIVAAIATEPARFDLAIDAIWSADHATVTVHATAVARVAAPPSAMLRLALFERHLTTKIAAGENRGRTLQHDTVVRLLGQAAGASGGRFELSQTTRPAADWKGKDLGVAAWIEDGDGNVLQATAGMLP